MAGHLIHSGFLVLALALAPFAAAAQEGDGMDINMDALKNRPTGMQPPPPPKAPEPAPQKPAKSKKFAGKTVAVLFEPGKLELDAAARQRLDAIAAQSRTQRLELKSYAGTDKQSASDTRRMALQRAITVRGYLIDKGMDGTRIALRPQGPATDGQAPERVDVRYLEE
ncbi:MAG: OmpA family protein [Sphingomonadales bacterium]